MKDFCIAECLPCKWEERHDTQQDAVIAAEKHVRAYHIDVPPEIRGKEKMGHVQWRTCMTKLEMSAQQPAPAAASSGTAADLQPSDVVLGTESLKQE